MPTVMTQSQFVLIQEIIRGLAIDRADREQVALEFAHVLATTNPRFKRSAFLRGCGVEKEPAPRKEY